MGFQGEIEIESVFEEKQEQTKQLVEKE
jgi:hypothetical protein